MQPPQDRYSPSQCEMETDALPTYEQRLSAAVAEVLRLRSGSVRQPANLKDISTRYRVTLTDLSVRVHNERPKDANVQTPAGG